MIQPFFNSDGTGVTVFITIIGSDGNHVDPDSWPITNDPAIVLSSHPSAAKTVTKIDDGVFKVVWSSLSPALTHGEIIYISIDGAISGTAWTTWVTPIQVVHLPAKVSDTQNIQSRLPAALIGGRMDASVGAMLADTLTASALSADALAEIQSGLATSAQATAIEADTQDIQNRLPSTLVGGKMDSNVASMDADTLTASALSADAVAEIQSSVMGLNSPTTVERSTDDDKPITFSWPVSGATITAEKSIDNGAYSAAAGAVSYLRQEGNKYYYVLAYNSADRVDEEAVVRYKLTDGVYEKYFNLRLVLPIANIPAGARAIVVTVADESDAPVRGARVKVLTSAGEPVGIEVTTSTLGTATVLLDDGAYKLRVVPPSLFASPADTSITVDSDETPVSITLTALVVEANPEPGNCLVYTYVKDANGNAVENAIMRARLQAKDMTLDGTVLSTATISSLSDSNGYVGLELVRQDQFVSGTGSYVISVYDQYEELLFELTSVIPNQDSVNLQDM